jgi:hypothetical protein
MENMRVLYHQENKELKKKLAASEKRLVHMWDYAQEQGKKHEAKFSEF